MYEVKIIPSARKDLEHLDKKFFIQVRDKIIALASEPRPNNCVKLTADEGYRVRSGNYRILYRIDDGKKTVYIYRVKHRSRAYR